MMEYYSMIKKKEPSIMKIDGRTYIFFKTKGKESINHFIFSFSEARVCVFVSHFSIKKPRGGIPFLRQGEREGQMQKGYFS